MAVSELSPNISAGESKCVDQCAACCRNMFFCNVSRAGLQILAGSQQVRIMPTTNQLPDVSDRRDYTPPGVYAAPMDGGNYMVVIGGPCPNLLPNYKCGVYDNRPQVCRSLPVGGENCTKARKRGNLSPLHNAYEGRKLFKVLRMSTPR